MLEFQSVFSENQPNSEVGTTVAVNNLNNGVPTKSARGYCRGGANNSAVRESFALSVDQVSNLKAAEGYAKIIGLPLNRMITIHWEAAGVPLEAMARSTGRFIDLVSKALSRRGGRTAWLWVHENAPNWSYEKGGHCHLLIHIPPELVSYIVRLQRGWLKRITGQVYRARVIHSKPIGGRLGIERGNPAVHAINAEAALGYLLKGASEDAVSKFALDRFQPSGRVIGKRCGTSQNIGRAARSAKQ